MSFDWAKRSHKGLRRWVLHIVADKPRTGAEIMTVMESNLQGWWRPSPGSIYPLLKEMTREGVLNRGDDEKTYSLTEKGKEELDHPFPWLGPSSAPRSVENVIEEISNYVSYLEDVEKTDPKVAESANELKEISIRLSKLGAGA